MYEKHGLCSLVILFELVFTGGLSRTNVRGGSQNKPETFEETTFTLSLWQIIDK